MTRETEIKLIMFLEEDGVNSLFFSIFKFLLIHFFPLLCFLADQLQQKMIRWTEVIPAYKISTVSD